MTIISTIQNKPSKISKELITSTIENHPEGVLTTVNSDGTPTSSVVTLHKFDDYHYFFMTKDTTKKYDNLEFNPNMTFMIFDPFSRTELEIKGMCEYIWDDHRRKHAFKIIDADAKKGRTHISPFVSKDKDPEAVLFAVYPQTIHFTTFWDQGYGPEMFQESIDFKLTNKID